MHPHKHLIGILLGLLALLALPAHADEVEILEARFDAAGENRWHVSVTVEHPDTGWDHYADAWRVLAPDGRELGERILHHPHVSEQPFTRGLRNVQIPPDLDTVVVEVRCSVDGWGASRLRVDLR